MIKNKDLNLAWSLFGKEKPEVVFKMFLKIAKNNSLDEKIRSEAYLGDAEVINCLSPSLGEKNGGYSYLKKSINLDQNNLQARLILCYLFNDIIWKGLVSEEEFLENIIYLLNIVIKNLNIKDNEEKKRIENETKNCIKDYLKQRLEKLRND